DPPLERVEGAAPPHDDGARGRSGEQRRSSEERGLRQEPAAAGDALRPREAVRALLELAREQRRADEEPCENRKHREHTSGRHPAGELALEVRDDDVAAATCGGRQAGREGVAVERGLNRQPRAEGRRGKRKQKYRR